MAAKREAAPELYSICCTCAVARLSYRCAGLRVLPVEVTPGIIILYSTGVTVYSYLRYGTVPGIPVSVTWYRTGTVRLYHTGTVYDNYGNIQYIAIYCTKEIYIRPPPAVPVLCSSLCIVLHCRRLLRQSLPRLEPAAASIKLFDHDGSGGVHGLRERRRWWWQQREAKPPASTGGSLIQLRRISRQQSHLLCSAASSTRPSLVCCTTAIDDEAFQTPERV